MFSVVDLGKHARCVF